MGLYSCLSDLAGAEVECAFDGGVLVAVGAVNGIGSDALSKISADGSGRCFGRVGGTDEGTEIRYCVVLFEDGGDDGSAAHVLRQLTVKRTLGVNGVECLGIVNAQLRPLHRLDGESSFDDAVDDFTCVAPASGIGLDHGECAVCGHGISLICGAKVLRISLFGVF